MPKAKSTTKSTRKSKAEGGVRKRAKKDPNAPKRNLTAYMMFVQQQRKVVQQENPTVSFGQIGKILGEKWKNLEEDEKKKYVKMAEKDKERYEKQKSEYEANKHDAADDKADEEVDEEDEEDEDDE
ncbi:uncharacterized protein VTP21DRAFT_11120 [Calcarisporiella thermophila]|uniref:uncharacterized protein n=1 Tax=Calcarisporiella thermophila TaxID=911321 RepID=UPI003743B5AB